MQENPKDAERADVLHQEEVDVEEGAHTQRTTVGELIVHQLMRQEPAYQYTGEESRYRQEYLSRHKVEYSEHRLAEEIQLVTHRS